MTARTAVHTFTATALSPVTVGGTSNGTNVRPVVRWSYLNDESTKFLSVPVIPASSFRGVLRRHAALVMHTLLGSPTYADGWTSNFDRIVSSGGSLEKATTVKSDQLDLVLAEPVLHLFGGSFRGSIWDGAVNFDTLVPICHELSGEGPKLGDLTENVQGVRHDSSFVRQVAGLPDDESDGNQMIFQNEVIKAGVRFRGGITFRPHATARDRALMAMTIRAWQDGGAHVGGRAATGHGRLRLEFDEPLDDSAIFELQAEWSSAEGQERHQQIRSIVAA